MRGIPRLNVMMDVSGTCNLRCRMCYFSLPGRRRTGQLPLEVFDRFCDEVGERALSFSLSMGAEPLVLRDFPRYLEIAASHRVPNLSFISNATLLTPELAEAIVDSGVRCVTFSIDGATKETYERIRTGAVFERTLCNVDTLARVKRERRSRTPYLCFHYILFRSNCAELPGFVRMVSKWDAKEINAGFAVEHADIDLSDERIGLDEARAGLREATELCRSAGILLTGSNAQVLRASERPAYYAGVVLRRLALKGWRHTASEIRAQLKERRTLCRYLDRFVFVDATGDVRPCCFWMNDEPLGNVAGSTFADVWESGDYALLRSLAPGPRARRFESCRNCRRGTLIEGRARDAG